MKTDGSDIQQHTKEESYDVREYSLSGNTLVYRSGADLYQMSLGQGQSEKIAIRLVSDFDQLREKWVDNPASYITNISVSNNGEKVALTARGRVFVFPAKEGRMLRLSRKDGVRYRDAVFTTDSKDILTFSDESRIRNPSIFRFGFGPRKAVDGKWHHAAIQLNSIAGWKVAGLDRSE